jgi:hypothetical protein
MNSSKSRAILTIKNHEGTHFKVLKEKLQLHLACKPLAGIHVSLCIFQPKVLNKHPCFHQAPYAYGYDTICEVELEVPTGGRL